MDKQKLANDLIRDEGLRLKPYHCTAGKLTVGVGRNLDDNGITKEEAMFLLNNDIDAMEAACKKEAWWAGVEGDEVRSRAMVNMAFNLGMARLSGFKNTLAAIRAKDWAKAAAGMRASLWYKQVGARAERIATMIEKGK